MNTITAVIKHTVMNQVCFRGHSILLYLAAASLFSSHASAEPTKFASAAADQEAEAKETWRKAIAKIEVPQDGCFHAAYPNYVWEKVDCKAAALGDQMPDEQVGGNNDYTIGPPGLIQDAEGSFQTSGVTSVETTGGTGHVVDGNGQYSIQLNTNNDEWTSVCVGAKPLITANQGNGCTVFTQFVYLSQAHPDPILNEFGLDNSPTMFIQYWLINYGPNCPAHWTSRTDPGTGALVNCVLTSSSMASPVYVPVSDLGNVHMTAFATPGGRDAVEFYYKGEAWVATDNDNTVKIGSVWHQAEFNIFGHSNGAEAFFNTGAAITITLSVSDGINSAPICYNNLGTTGESNNLVLGPCTRSVDAFGQPTIQFTESTATSLLGGGSVGLLPPTIVNPPPP